MSSELEKQEAGGQAEASAQVESVTSAPTDETDPATDTASAVAPSQAPAEPPPETEQSSTPSAQADSGVPPASVPPPLLVVARQTEPEAQVLEPSPSPRHWQDVLGWVLLLAVTGLGMFLRFYELGLKPLHHDEGVNGWFIMRLLDEGKYAYNPKNYHGPLLYVLNTLPVIIAGQTDAALRFMPALLGGLAVPAMALFLRPLGWAGVLLAAAYIAVAPVEVYFSKTAIHEIYNFTFNVTLAGAIVAWIHTRRQVWLTAAVVSLVCLFGTKETTIITVAAVVPALLGALYLGRGPLPSPGMMVQTSSWLGRLVAVPWYLGAALLIEKEALKKAAWIGLAVWAFLFSFWLNPLGLGSFFAAFFLWGDTGVEGKGHEKIWYYFFTHLLWPYYRPEVLLGGFGLLWGALRRQRLALFALGWFVLAAAAYAIIPYKTPWCVLSFSTPLFIGMGVLGQNAVGELRYGTLLTRAISAVLLLASLGMLVQHAVPLGSYEQAFQKFIAPFGPREARAADREVARVLFSPHNSWTLNLEEYDVKGHPFIYVQNVREYDYLTTDLNNLLTVGQVGGDEKKPVMMLIDAKNPMRWYLRKSGTQLWRKKWDEDAKKKLKEGLDVICVSKEEANAVKGSMGPDYVFRRYHERPGRKIDLYVKKSLWEAYEDAARRGVVSAPSPTFKEKSTSDRRTPEMKEAWSKRAMN